MSEGFPAPPNPVLDPATHDGAPERYVGLHRAPDAGSVESPAVDPVVVETVNSLDTSERGEVGHSQVRRLGRVALSSLNVIRPDSGPSTGALRPDPHVPRSARVGAQQGLPVAGSVAAHMNPAMLFPTLDLYSNIVPLPPGSELNLVPVGNPKDSDSDGRPGPAEVEPPDVPMVPEGRPEEPVSAPRRRGIFGRAKDYLAKKPEDRGLDLEADGFEDEFLAGQPDPRAKGSGMVRIGNTYVDEHLGKLPRGGMSPRAYRKLMTKFYNGELEGGVTAVEKRDASAPDNLQTGVQQLVRFDRDPADAEAKVVWVKPEGPAATPTREQRDAAYEETTRQEIRQEIDAAYAEGGETRERQLGILRGSNPQQEEEPDADYAERIEGLLELVLDRYYFSRTVEEGVSLRRQARKWGSPALKQFVTGEYVEKYLEDPDDVHRSRPYPETEQREGTRYKGERRSRKGRTTR